jgi:hypothetical protein
VAAERQPFVQFAMVDQQDFAVVNDEDRHGEIDFFMNVRHAAANIQNSSANIQRKH